MRNANLLTSTTLLALYSFLPTPSAKADTFTLDATGYDSATGLTTTADFSLIRTAAPLFPGAYNLTNGTGTVTVSNGAGVVSTDDYMIFLFANTSPAHYATATFGPPLFTPSQYEFDDVVYPDGTQLNDANGEVLDEYGILFSSDTDH